jgi:protease-4
MGSSAASGGYYISAPADYIIANNTTLTGSIGVFGIIFNVENTLKNLLGITIDNVGTSATAAGISLVQPLQPRQREILKKEVNLTYNTFLRRVADGRNLKVEDVAKVAEGRVWSGAQAVENGLVDFVGGLSEALNIALNLADLRDNFSLYEILPPPTPLEQFIESMGLNFVQSCNIDYDIDMATIQEFVLNNRFLVNNGGIQAVMPIDVKVNL